MNSDRRVFATGLSRVAQQCRSAASLGLLRSRRKRPHNRRTAEKRDELAPFHARPKVTRQHPIDLTSTLIGDETRIKPQCTANVRFGS